jgi:hypothetical protein
MASGGYRPAQALANYVGGEGARKAGEELQVGTDFPIVCETCLGPNPYVRMIKMKFGDKLCKISNMPYQSFRWKAGPQGRFKECIVSREVALDKNICQARWRCLCTRNPATSAPSPTTRERPRSRGSTLLHVSAHKRSVF